MTLEQWLVSAEALLDLDAKGAIAPHGIGGHARTLLTEATKLLRSQPAGVRVAEGMKDRLKMLVSEYWDLAYTEGKEGRTTDTPNGGAGRVWWQITELLEQFEALSRFPALEPQQEEAVAVERWRKNSIDTWAAMTAMRNSINEHIPMPSIESDLLQGPENSVFCAAVADAVTTYVVRTSDLLESALYFVESKYEPAIDSEHELYQQLKSCAAHPTPTQKEQESQRVSKRPEIETELEALRRLAAGDRIVYSRDGEMAWFQNGDRAWLADDVIMELHLSCSIETLNEGEDEDWHEWSQITQAGRDALKALEASHDHVR